MGLLGNIVGGIAKNIFPKHTIAGKILGSTREAKSSIKSPVGNAISTVFKKPVQAATLQLKEQMLAGTGLTLAKQSVNGSGTAAALQDNKMLVYVGAGVLVLLSAIIAFIPKRKRRRR